MLAEQREEALRQAKEHERAAKEHEEAKVQMFLEMESTLTTLTHEHALQLQAVQKEKEDKERQLQAILVLKPALVRRSGALAASRAAAWLVRRWVRWRRQQGARRR